MTQEVVRQVLAAVAVLGLCGAVQPPAAVSGVGERIYREGELASGGPLRGERVGAPQLVGKEAACAQCHLRSGLGMVEGQIVIPPIGGRFLFHTGHRISRDSPIHAGMSPLLPSPPDRPAYDETTLARAIRDGIGADSRRLDYLMPRFDLDDASMRELIEYLKHLSSGRMRGVSDSALQFATIVTPDADAVTRDGMLDVLERYFEEKNSRYIGENVSPVLQGGRPIRLHTQRRWQLHVWQLAGSPETWEAQLDERLRREPVFAVISGLAGATWEPVHRFCERQAIPCLLPNVDLPVVENREFYSVYFSQGALLEAQLVAARLAQSKEGAASRGRIVQVYRDNDIGAAAAARLHTALPDGTAFVDRALGPGDGARKLAQAVAEAKAGDVLVLWLRATDLAALPAPPARLAAVYASGLMGGLEQAPLRPKWRELARITYPCALPDERSLRLNYPLGWFRLRGIKVAAERVQVDTYVACSVLLETLASMLDEFVPEYLVERTEEMLDSRIVNGYYTRLGLGPGQRFASKGGYLVRFVGPTGTRVTADGNWIVP